MNASQCRICLQYIECMFKLDDKVRDRFIWEALNSIANISVVAGDSFPQLVCWNCFDKLDQAIQFQFEVERSDKALHSNDIECITFIKEEVNDERNILEPIVKIESSKSHIFIEDDVKDTKIKEEIPEKVVIPPKKPKRKRKSRAKSAQIDPKDIKFRCCVCHEHIYETEQGLRDHIQSLHQTQIETNEYRKYTTRHRHQCKYCNLKFRLRGSLTDHIENPEFIEPKRNRSVEYASQKGKPKVKDRQKLVCSYCGKIFGNRDMLKQHELRMHTEDLPFICMHDGCGKKYASAKLLRQHAEVHGAKNYICNTCGKAFLKEKNLIIHSFVHEEVKRFQCDICLRTFTLRYILKLHIKSHFQVQIFPCDLCEKTYKWSTDLKKHIQYVHKGDPPYKCKFCNKGYFSSSSRKYHQDRCQRHVDLY